MFGNLEDMQEEMRAQLTNIIVKSEAGGGLVKVEANAARQITNISIDPEFLQSAEAEEVEDLLLVALNQALLQATEQEAAQTREMVQKMMPGGLGGLANLFGS